MVPLGETPAEAAVRELDAISYDLFANVSSRLWGHGKVKEEIRALQGRIDAVKWKLLEAELALTERVNRMADFEECSTGNRSENE